MIKQKIENDNDYSEFTESELRYLADHNLARLAFVCSDMKAHIMPVLYEFDGSFFYLSGWNLKYSQRFNEVPRSTKVTLLVDDVNSPEKWVPKGVEIEGEAETKEKDEYVYVRVKPVNKTSWGF
jgi:pyridoxamine 5'-phosphate oxidase family protein